VVAAGGDGRDLGREKKGRRAATHAAAAGVGEGADVGIAFDLFAAAGDERREGRESGTGLRKDEATETGTESGT
jgi:hypothetical protein